jgi:hypothetical protein
MPTIDTLFKACPACTESESDPSKRQRDTRQNIGSFWAQDLTYLALSPIAD